MRHTVSPQLLDEPGRLSALDRYQVLDTAPEAAFDKITALVKKVFGAPMVAVSLVDTDRQWFKSRQGIDTCEMSRDASFCSVAIRSPGHMAVPDALRDPRFRNNPLVTGAMNLRSYLGMPLRTPEGYHLGALCVLDTVARSYDPLQVNILQGFAELVQDEFELRLIAQSDHLTGILSRRAFMGEMTRAMTQFQRCHRPCTLVMFDIDHFKRVNDTYGHHAGDLTLRAVAEGCRWAMRRGEVFGRLGGEEFGVLLADTNLEQGMQAAERFRHVISTLMIPHEPPIQITASFGVAQFLDSTGRCDDWMAAADSALYVAKQEGRNCCQGSTKRPHLVA